MNVSDLLLGALAVAAIVAVVLRLACPRAQRPLDPTVVSAHNLGLASGRGAVVVVPTYDEAANIRRLLDGVLAQAPEVHLLVVDDASPDGTADLVRAHPDFRASIFLLERSGKQGLGAAYRAGFEWSLERDYGRIVQMDADLSHPVERVPVLLAALAHADVAVGSRYVAGGGVRNWAWQRRLISRVGNLYVALVLGLRIKDATAGFKAFRREALELIGATDATSEGYCFQIENAWQARRRGLTIREVPITFTDRAEGTSKMSGSIVNEALTRVLQWRLQELRDLHRHPIRRRFVAGDTRPGPGVRSAVRNTLARCTSWWSTTKNGSSRSSATISDPSERPRTDATTG